MTISPTVKRHPDHDDECVVGTRCVGFRCEVDASVSADESHTPAADERQAPRATPLSLVQFAHCGSNGVAAAFPGGAVSAHSPCSAPSTPRGAAVGVATWRCRRRSDGLWWNSGERQVFTSLLVC